MVTLKYNKQQYKNVRHQATRRAQKWLKKLRHLDAIQVLFVSVANESPVGMAVNHVSTRNGRLWLCCHRILVGIFWYHGAPIGE